MSEKLFKIIFKGEIINGFSIEDVKTSFSRLFKVNRIKTDSLFNGKSYVLKKGLNKERAEKVKKLFEDAGGKCYIIRYENNPFNSNQFQQEEKKTIRTSSEKDRSFQEERNKVIKVSDLIRTDSLNKINSIIPEKKIILDSVNTNIKETKAIDTSESGISPEVTPMQKPNYSAEDQSLQSPELTSVKPETEIADEIILSESAKIYVTFRGEIKSDTILSEVKGKIASYFGIGENDTEILFTGKPIVLKIYSDNHKAERFADILNQTGMITEIITLPSTKESELSTDVNDEDLRNALINRETAIAEIRKTRKQIDEIKQLRKDFLYFNNQRKEAVANSLSISPFRNIRNERYKMNQLMVNLKNAMDKYNNSASKLTIETNVSLAIPYGILAGSISKLIPQLNPSTEDNSFYRTLKTKNDIENLNISNVYIKELLSTIIDFNKLFDEIESVRKNAYEDFNNAK